MAKPCRRTVAIVAVTLCCLIGGVPGAEETYSPLASGNLAEVVTATFLGSPGNEWLSAGAFLPNDTILLCGVSLESEVVLGGRTAAVLGRDAPALPRLKEYRLVGERATGKMELPTVESSGVMKSAVKQEDEGPLSLEDAGLKPRKAAPAPPPRNVSGAFVWQKPLSVEKSMAYERLHWAQSEATGFLAIASGDLKKVHALCRLPRGAGSITSAAVGADGAIYIAGAATERISLLSDNSKRYDGPDANAATAMKAERQYIYIAKLSGDLSKVLWVRTVTGDTASPRLVVLKNGDIALRGPDMRWFSPEGQLRRAFPISRARNPDSASADPVGGGYAKGGDFMTGTGHGPYRVPYTFVYGPDGKMDMELFRWHGLLVGLESTHLEADASILKTTYDNDGNLILYGWTHGGNTALLRYPWDIDRFWPNGLGYFGVSPGYVLKISPDYKLLAATVWMSGARITTPGFAVDGSIAWAGLTGRVERMSNAFSAAPGPLALVVTEPDLAAYRFYSAMPGCGSQVAVGGGTSNGEQWGIVTGKLGGKPMLLFLTGAVEGETVAGVNYPTPLKNPVQASYAGGLMDGYALLLDLSRKGGQAGRAKPAAAPGPAKTGAAGAGPATKPVRQAEPPIVAAEGQVFHVGEGPPASVKMTFRDAEEAFWPTFYMGGADPDGSFTYSTGKTAAGFRLHCPDAEQTEGRQDRRVLGSLIRMRTGEYKDKRGNIQQREFPDPDMSFVVRDMSAWKLDERTQERTGETLAYRVPSCTVDGELHAGKQIVPVTAAACEASFHVPRGVNPKEPGNPPNVALLEIRFTLRGQALGLTEPLAQKDIRVLICCTGYATVKYPKDQHAPPPNADKIPVELPSD